jgi:TPR repeat protein
MGIAAKLRLPSAYISRCGKSVMRCVQQGLRGALLVLTLATNVQAQPSVEERIRGLLDELNAELERAKRDASELDQSSNAGLERAQREASELEQALGTANVAPVAPSVPSEIGSPDATALNPEALIQVQPLTTSQLKEVARADALLKDGDISGARLLLQHLLSTDHPDVTFKLAQTYDPKWLATHKVIGVRGDSKKARELYVRAQASGNAEAQDRIAELR